MGFIWIQNRHYQIHITFKRSGICCLYGHTCKSLTFGWKN